MTKTGWPPPLLMQDDNPQLSRWFATRPDALYVLKTNQRKKQMKFEVRNHNDTLLGVFDNVHDALKEAMLYRHTTSNPAYVDEVKENDDES